MIDDRLVEFMEALGEEPIEIGEDRVALPFLVISWEDCHPLEGDPVI